MMRCEGCDKWGRETSEQKMFQNADVRCAAVRGEESGGVEEDGESIASSSSAAAATSAPPPPPHTHTHKHTHSHPQAYIYINTYKHTQTRVHTIFMYVRLCMRMHISLYISIYYMMNKIYPFLQVSECPNYFTILRRYFANITQKKRFAHAK